MHARVFVSLRAPGHNAPLVELQAEVVWSSKLGGTQPAGVAVRWLHAECTAGAEPLKALLRTTLRVAAPDIIEHSATRTASFDFQRHEQRRAGQPVTAGQGAIAQFRTAGFHAATPGARPIPRAVPADTAFDRSAAARRGARQQPFPQLRPISAPYEAQSEITARYQPVAEVPAAPPDAREATAPLPNSLTPILAVGPPSARRRPETRFPLPPALPPQPVPVPSLSTNPSSTPRLPAESPRRRASGTMRAELGPRTRISSTGNGSLRPTPSLADPSDEARSWPMGVPRVLAERYSNLTLLGQGGHGIVFRAQDLLQDRLVVLKFLAGTGMAPDQARRYFLREFKVAADLLHPNIVRLYDIGSADGTLYYTMEHVPGHALVHYLGKDQRLDDWEFVHSVFAQLASALDHAHAHGVLHRDVKPSNVLVADDGTVRLFDFGLARLSRDGERDQSMVVGTPFYMAPEMQQTAPIDHRADQYALGVLLFRMLTGRVPFADGNVFLAHATQPVPDPRTLRPELPAGVTDVVLRMLAKDPAARYTTCGEAAVALRPGLVAS